jgi:hypothetical protein
MKLPILPSKLPCFPCPHNSNCCSWGSSLTGDEDAIIAEIYGIDSIMWDEEENGWRTAVVNGKCFFLSDSGSCKIHAEEYYPQVCKLFPYESVEGGPYKYDLEDVCPELKDK